jgi:hypothetical protein
MGVVGSHAGLDAVVGSHPFAQNAKGWGTGSWMGHGALDGAPAFEAQAGLLSCDSITPAIVFGSVDGP